MVQSFPLQSLTRCPPVRVYAIRPYLRRGNSSRNRDEYVVEYTVDEVGCQYAVEMVA